MRSRLFALCLLLAFAFAQAPSAAAQSTATADGTPSAQAQAGDLCHVYLVDVEKARKALEEYRDTDDAARDTKAIADAQVVFPEFRTVVGEEQLTTKSYPFPGARLFITASVFYTDESMASAHGSDSMQLAVAVGPKVLPDALDAEDNAAAELTLDGADTARAKKYLKVGGRRYLVGVECRHR
ncbi:MAG TPA: hypothetical protein VJ866_00225 [Pyrinomonadaceae bacterium]|nr:hypothetical protein [Pyrinomonadaceae bacterium]